MGHALYGCGRASCDVSELRGHGADGEAFQIVRGRCAGPWFATHHGRDHGTDDRRTFPRRSDAKRWLLARAAGLAEVPMMRLDFVSRATGLAVENTEPRRPPRGWRLFDVDSGTRFDTATGERSAWARSYYERNRRRR